MYIVVRKIDNLRGVAQMGARVVWDHEVAGSIPVTPTINYQKVLTKHKMMIIINNANVDMRV